MMRFQILLVLWSIVICLIDPPFVVGAASEMITAKWNGVVLAQSDDVVELEGNKYFPMASLKMNYFQKCSQTTTCPWKGLANYYDIVVNDKKNAGAAWYYANPKPEAAKIKDRVAFWKGVQIS